MNISTDEDHLKDVQYQQNVSRVCDSQVVWENVKFEECFKYELAFSKEKTQLVACALMTGGSAR